MKLIETSVAVEDWQGMRRLDLDKLLQVLEIWDAALFTG